MRAVVSTSAGIPQAAPPGAAGEQGLRQEAVAGGERGDGSANAAGEAPEAQ